VTVVFVVGNIRESYSVSRQIENGDEISERINNIYLEFYRESNSDITQCGRRLMYLPIKKVTIQ